MSAFLPPHTSHHALLCEGSQKAAFLTYRDRHACDAAVQVLICLPVEAYRGHNLNLFWHLRLIVIWSDLIRSDMSSWPARYVFLSKQEDMSSCRTRRSVLKKTRVLVQSEDMYSFSTRRHACLFDKKTCLLVRQVGVSSWSTRRHVLKQGDLSSC